jgi:N-acetylglucosamine-6-phosphate deacetylase
MPPGRADPDLLHVHPGAMHAALRAIPGLYAVTDATAAAGMPDGDYRWAGRPCASAKAACAWPTARWPAAR